MIAAHPHVDLPIRDCRVSMCGYGDQRTMDCRHCVELLENSVPVGVCRHDAQISAPMNPADRFEKMAGIWGAVEDEKI